MLSTVIGLPFLLLLEPFLNSKVNFTRLKPLLDQFQGSYKNKHRFFAAYYMICQLVIILIVIANPTNNNTISFLLVSSTAALALIHLIFRPYAKLMFLTYFDAMILQLMSLASALPLVGSAYPDVLLAVVIIFLILPIITFTTMELIINKGIISKIAAHFRSNPVNASHNDEIPVSDIGIIKLWMII